MCSLVYPVSTAKNCVRMQVGKKKKATQLMEHLQCAELYEALHRMDSFKKLRKGRFRSEKGLKSLWQ